MNGSAGAVFIDLLFLLLWMCILYSAVSRGILSELIKIIGLVGGIFFAFQYYSSIGSTVIKPIPFLNKGNLHLAIALAILLGIKAIFGFLGLIVWLLFKRENIGLMERWGAFFIGSFRAALLCSVILFLFHLSSFNLEIFSQTASNGLFRKIAPFSYLAIQRSIAAFNSKFSANKNVEDYLYSPD